MYSWTDVVRGLAPFYISADSKVNVFTVECENEYRNSLIVKQLLCVKDEEVDKAMKEGAFAKANPFPHICECYDYLQEPRAEGGSFVYIIMPSMKGGTLDEEVKRRSATRDPVFFPEKLLFKILRDLVAACAFLQEKNIAHRDIKPQNIVLDTSKEEAFICDFGYAKEINLSGAALHTLLGTMPYFSPKLRSALIEGERNIIHVQHNVFKSDVYSLGVVMLYMTILEKPPFITNLKDLQLRINGRLSEIMNYSDEWKQILSRMITVDEVARPDFIQLRGEIDCPLLFADDEAIEAQVESAPIDPLQITIKCGLAHIRVSQTLTEHVPCMISLKASEQDPNARMYSTDLVCVIDQSGSMGGERLTLMQDTLKQIVGLMGDRDRMSIVTFSDDAKRECGLIACTQAGKERLMRHISELTWKDLTNISAGFIMGLDVIRQRRVQNTSTSLLLFTDGKHNIDDDPLVICLDALQHSAISKFSVHCFGFGSDLDTKLLEKLAFEGHGVFHHIKGSEEISAAFALAFANITSVVARNISVSLRINRDGSNGNIACKIGKVYSKDGSDKFFLPNITANTCKDLIFFIQTPYMVLDKPARLTPVTAYVSYVDNEDTETTDKPVPLAAKFMPWVDVKPQQDASVFANWNRVKGVNALKEAREFAEKCQFREADERLSNSIEDLYSSGYCGHPMMLAVIKDLEEAKKLVQDQRSWGRGGESEFASISYSHYSQSASTRGSLYTSLQQNECVNAMQRGTSSTNVASLLSTIPEEMKTITQIYR